jgi:hypothetical protein
MRDAGHAPTTTILNAVITQTFQHFEDRSHSFDGGLSHCPTSVSAISWAWIFRRLRVISTPYWLTSIRNPIAACQALTDLASGE